jgi:hypothetical protein
VTLRKRSQDSLRNRLGANDVASARVGSREEVQKLDRSGISGER